MFDLDRWISTNKDYDYQYNIYKVDNVAKYHANMWALGFNGRICVVPFSKDDYIPKVGSIMILKTILGSIVLGVVIDGYVFKNITRAQYYDEQEKRK